MIWALLRHLQRWSELDSCLNRYVFGIADASGDGVQFGARVNLGRGNRQASKETVDHELTS